MKDYIKSLIGIALAVIITCIPFFMGKATEDFAMVFYMLALWVGIPSIILYLREMFSD